MDLRIPDGVRAGRLVAALAASVLLGAALLPASVLAANAGATKLAIMASSLSGNATAGASFTLTVQAQDATSTLVTGFTDAVTVSSSDSQAIVTPGSPYTYLAGDHGSRVFTVTLKTIGSQTVTFASTGLASAIATITVEAAAASALMFTQQPSTSPSGVAFLSQPRVAIRDAFGNVVPTAGATVTLTLVAPTSGSGALSGCTSSVSGGIATFSGCHVTGTGIGFKLTATDTTGGGGGHPYAAATSASFDIPDNLGFQAQPGGGSGTGNRAQGGIAFSSQPRVIVRDGTSNFTSNAAVNNGTTVVTLAIRSGTGTAGAILACDQAGNTLRVTAGSAQFSGCRIDKSGTGYQLVATSVPAYGANAWYSATFDVLAGPATRLLFVTQPAGASAGQAFTTQPVVAIADAGGNIATSGVSANVTLTIGANPGVPAGVLTCTPTTTMATATNGTNAGKAVFAGCRISNSGAGYTLVATASSVVPGSTTLAPATSTPFNVGAPSAEITLTPSASVITWGQTVVLTTQFGVNGAGQDLHAPGRPRRRHVGDDRDPHHGRVGAVDLPVPTGHEPVLPGCLRRHVRPPGGDQRDGTDGRPADRDPATDEQRGRQVDLPEHIGHVHDDGPARPAGARAGQGHVLVLPPVERRLGARREARRGHRRGRAGSQRVQVHVVWPVVRPLGREPDAIQREQRHEPGGAVQRELTSNVAGRRSSASATRR